jgi:hypothetical protein
LIYETPKQNHECWQFTLPNQGQTADLILVQHFESVQYGRPLKILSIRTHYVKPNHQLCTASGVTIFLIWSSRLDRLPSPVEHKTFRGTFYQVSTLEYMHSPKSNLVLRLSQHQNDALKHAHSINPHNCEQFCKQGCPLTRC